MGGGQTTHLDSNITLRPSTSEVRMSIETHMVGASQKIVAQGLSRPIGSSSSFLSSLFVAPCPPCAPVSRICVRAHLNPPHALAINTNNIPPKANWVSVATMSTTPPVMSRMTDIRRVEKCSSLKMKAKKRTKTRDDDLHIASRMFQLVHMGVGAMRLLL